MSEKNFKIGTSGLDLDGGLLSTNVLSNAISFNGNLLASEEYVTNALAGVDADLSDNAGLHLSWNAETPAFDVNVNSLVGDLDGAGLYVANNQLAINTNVVATLTDTQTLSNKTLESPTVTISNSISVPSSSSNLIYGSSGGTPFVAFSTNVNLALGSLSIGTTVTIPSGLVGAGTYTITSLTDPVGFSSPIVGYTISDPENALSGVFRGGGGDSIATGYTIVVAAGSTTISSTELSYLDGVTSAIQTQLDAKLSSVNTQAVATSLSSSTLYVSDTDNLNVNVNAIVGDLDGEGLYFNNNQLAINTNVVVTLTGAQDISNKKIIDTLYFSDGVTVSEEGEIAVKATTHEFEIKANYGDLDLKTVATDGTTGSNVNISSLYGDIVLNANGASYIGSVAEGNQITTKSYVDGIVNTNAIAGSLASSTLFVDSADNLNVNVNAIVGDLDGTGLYVDGFTLAVNTNAIATKAYVDSVAQGLDVKASVKVASTANIAVGTFDYTAGNVDEIALNPGDRVLLKNQTAASENGIYVADPSSTALVRAADADNLTDLTQGAFTFVENGTVNAGKGFVLSALLATGEVLASIAIQTWTQFSEAGSLTAGSNIYLSSGSINVNVNSLVGDLDGTGLYVDGTTLAVNVNALAGTGLTVNGNQLEAAPAFITTTDASFAVTDGELSLSDNITIASVELTDSVNNVTAASDVFGNGSTSAYDMGSNETIGTLPAAYEVADVFVTLESSTGASRTSKFTHVNTGGDAPTWTEYGIIVSGSFPATTISFDASGNVIANVTGSGTYSAKGVATILK
jgi:hypothetical protein